MSVPIRVTVSRGWRCVKSVVVNWRVRDEHWHIHLGGSSVSERLIWSDWLKTDPHFTFYCCGCDSVHRLAFRVVDGRAQMRVAADDRATTAARAGELDFPTYVEENGRVVSGKLIPNFWGRVTGPNCAPQDRAVSRHIHGVMLVRARIGAGERDG